MTKAELRVIKAACRWVNVNDQGSISDLMRLTNSQTELGRAVAALEKEHRRNKRR